MNLRKNCATSRGSISNIYKQVAIVLLVLFILLIMPVRVQAWGFYPSHIAQKNLPRVLLIGDSIVNGYRGKVVQLLEGKANVDVWLTPANLNTPNLYEQLGEILKHGPYDVIHFNIGLHGWAKGRIPAGLYGPLMRQYIEILLKQGKGADLIWGSITPVTEMGHPGNINKQINPIIVRRNKIAGRIMQEYGIVVDDLYGLMINKLELAKGDRFHWTAKGFTLEGTQVARYIEQALIRHNLPLVNYYIAEDGNDNNPGTKAKPFATLTAARDAIRKLKVKAKTALRITVYIRGGIYELPDTLALNAQDSGSAAIPVRYCAYNGERVYITGGREINDKYIKRVTDKNILQRIISKQARSRVLEVNLRALGITDYGKMHARGFRRPYGPAPMELFIDGRAMRLARWPNPGEPLIPVGKVIDHGSYPRGGDYSNRGGKFHYAPDRLSLWSHARDIWLSGFFGPGYADDTVKVASIDTKNKVITTAQATMYRYNSGASWQRWYALNLLEEIDQPCEYYIARDTGILYFYPPTGFDKTKSQLQVSMLDGPMIALEGANYIYFEGITFECTRGIGIYIERGQGNRITGCTLRNMGIVAVCMGRGTENLKHYAHQGIAKPASRRLGSWHECIYANPIFNRKAGKNQGLISCDIYGIGAGGISLSGGNRETLQSGGNFVLNCHIHNYNRLERSYKAGVNIDGVGNRIEHCLINDAPASAIYLHGNSHIIEYNEVYDVMMDGDDMGAFYMGRDPSEFGNIIRYNYFHNLGIGPTAHGTWCIYYDDMACGTKAYGNVFYKAGRRGVFQVGGGKYNEIYNNIFVDCNLAIRIDNRGQGWSKSVLSAGGLFRKRLSLVHITKKPYSTAYPKLAHYWQDNPALPADPVERNLIVRCGRFFVGQEKWGPVKDNFQTSDDPGFVDMADCDFTLKQDAMVYQKIKGFKPVPFAKMGLYTDRWRIHLPRRYGQRPVIDYSKVKLPDFIRINFQVSRVIHQQGYLADWGEVFQVHPNGYAYGWTEDNTDAARKRGKNSDILRDTLVHFTAGVKWEIALAKGTYEVAVCLGDSEYPCNDVDLWVESVKFIENGLLKSNEFEVLKGTVNVRDGLLTLSSNNNPHGPGLTRINYIIIRKLTKPSTSVKGVS